MPSAGDRMTEKQLMARSKITTFDNLSLQELDQDSELIPLLTPEDEQEMNNEELPETLPILPLRNTVLFPGVVIPITAGRDKSIHLIKDANNGPKVIGVVSQKDETVENPGIQDINTLGTVARILRVLQMPDGNTTVIIQGKKRFEIAEVLTEEPYLTATIRETKETRPDETGVEFTTIIDSIKELARQPQARFRAAIDDLFDPRLVMDKESGRSKRAHLESLQARLRLRFAEMTFVDDKLNHLETVAPLGVRAVLAGWGFNTPREHELATAKGYPVANFDNVEEVLYGGGNSD